MRLMTTRMESRKLFVSFKMSEVCNLDCPYCYFFFNGDESHKNNPASMSVATAERAGQFLAEGARELEIPTVSIALHGGEPLMVGKKRFREIAETLIRTVTPCASLQMGVQTNGVLLDEEWIKLFSELNISVGISIDGPKHVNDSVRFDKKKRGSYDRIVKAITLLKKSHKEGLIGEPGALAVILPGTSAKEIYNHIVHDLGLWKFDFMLPKDSWENYSPEMTHFIESFSLELLECWLEDDNPQINVRTMKNFFAPFLTDFGVDMRINYIVDLIETITIRSNGDVSPDDSLPSISEEYRHTGCNVATSTLKEFYSNPLWTDLRRTVSTPPETCAKCEWLGYCGGGELITRYSKSRKFNNPTIYCSRNKALYSRVRQYLSNYMDLKEVDERTRRSNELALNELVLDS
jgi:uncharacterized protein